MQIKSAINNLRRDLLPLYKSVRLSHGLFTIGGKEYIQINGVLDAVPLAVIYPSVSEGDYNDAFVNKAFSQLNNAFHSKSIES